VLDLAGWVAARQGDYPEGRRFYEESLAICRRLGDRRGMAQTLIGLGSTEQYRGDFASACRHQEAGLALYRELHDERGVALSMGNLGLTLAYHGDYSRARRLLQGALRLTQRLRDDLRMSYNLNNLGIAAVRQRNLAEAEAFFVESLRVKIQFGNLDGIPYALEGLAELSALRGESERTVRLLVAAGAVREAVGHPRNPPSERAHGERLLAAGRAALGEAFFATAWAESRKWSIEQSVAYAITGSADGLSSPPAAPVLTTARHAGDTGRP
jgi:tetratricopeptide (TPR) repeat protein